jgi:hypothetical protein
VLAVRGSMALGLCFLPASLATVALPTKAGTADTKHRRAPAALSRAQRDTALCHRHRKPGVDSDTKPWDA